jgi:hypothetical protein
MNTWMVIACIWALFAVCVVLFLRGASSNVIRHDDARETAPRGGDVSRMEV